MLSQILSVFTVIKELIALIRMFMDMAEKQKSAEAERRRVEREKAVEDLKNAQTDEEIFDAQDRIVRNKP